MRAVRLVEQGRAEFVQVPKPRVEAGKVLVRSRLLSLCGSDVYRMYHAPLETFPGDVGTTGHEMIGTVEEVGPNVRHVRSGDMVLALAPEHRAMSEFFLAEADYVIPIPSGKPLEHYLMAQQLGTVIYGCKRLPEMSGKDVVVLGQGSAGLFLNFILRRKGAARVIGVDVKPARIDAAADFGATHQINSEKEDLISRMGEITDGRFADLVVEAVGEPEVISTAAHLVKERGNLLFFGIPRVHRFEFDFWTFFRQHCTTYSTSASHREPGQRSFRKALDLVDSGVVDVSTMITHRFPFKRVLEAYELARTREDRVIKIVINMD